LWNILLGLPVITCVLGAGLLFIFFPETPSALLRKNKNPKQAKKALERLRQSNHVEDELESIQLELNKDSKPSTSFSIADLFTRPELRWPLITGLVIQIAQQLCGVNAVNMIILLEPIFNNFYNLLFFLRFFSILVLFLQTLVYPELTSNTLLVSLGLSM
jgi:hypothetical protein